MATEQHSVRLGFSRVFKGLIFLATAYFLGKTAIAHGQELQTLQLQPLAGLWLIAAIALILGSEVIAGVLWHSTLDYLRQSVPVVWAVRTFFTTTLAKYLPGNVWHLVGRVEASRQFGVALDRVGLSVILETLFMVFGGIMLSFAYLQMWRIQVGVFLAMLLLLHPWGISKVFQFLAWVKHLQPTQERAPVNIQDVTRYPIREMLLGGVFIFLRSLAFCLTLDALTTLKLSDLPHVIGGFGMAWSLGIVLPAPGGIGVFESAAIQFMDGVGTPGALFSAVLLFRFLCIISESLGASLITIAPKLQALSRRTYHSWSAIASPSFSVGPKSES